MDGWVMWVERLISWSISEQTHTPLISQILTLNISSYSLTNFMAIKRRRLLVIRTTAKRFLLETVF